VVEMSLTCSNDIDEAIGWYEIKSHAFSAQEQCCECNKEILKNVEAYRVEQYEYDEDGEEKRVPNKFLCEPCGDLVLSFTELNYCWTVGRVREDIKLMNELAEDDENYWDEDK
jgi:hypothetical protein